VAASTVARTAAPSVLTATGRRVLALAGSWPLRTLAFLAAAAVCGGGGREQRQGWGRGWRAAPAGGVRGAWAALGGARGRAQRCDGVRPAASHSGAPRRLRGAGRFFRRAAAAAALRGQSLCAPALRPRRVRRHAGPRAARWAARTVPLPATRLGAQQRRQQRGGDQAAPASHGGPGAGRGGAERESGRAGAGAGAVARFWAWGVRCMVP
jgi:hypothetical protein